MRIGLLLLLLTSFSGAAPKRPNVLFLFTDDQRQDTIRAWGNDKIETPHMDRLVRDGVSFCNAYTMGGSSPAVCSPSRACLMTGRTLWNIECQGLFGFEISDKYKTLPQVFREVGYETFATGKNEPGKDGAFARSFSTAEAILFKGMTRSQYKLQLHDFRPEGDYGKVKATLREGTHSAELYADAAIRFLNKQRNADKPFFAYVAFQTPHDPLDVPEDYLARYNAADIPVSIPFYPEHPFDNGMLDIRDEKLEAHPRTEEMIRKRLAAYYALVTYTDAQIGRILKALDENGQTENTIIVFSSDNGLALGSHGLLGKQNVYEHSVKVPLIVAGPGLPKGQERQQLAYIYDIYPTLCELAGIKAPDTVQFRSLVAVMEDAGASHRDHLYFAFMEWQRAIRGERYKLIEYCVKGNSNTQLFDLREDPHEIHDLASDPAHAGILEAMRAVLRAERILLKDGFCESEFSKAQGQKFWLTFESTLSTSRHTPQPSIKPKSP